MSYQFCKVEQVRERLLVEDATYDTAINSAIYEATCYVENALLCHQSPVISNCMTEQITADFATGIFKRRTFKSKSGFESFDTRYWWEQGDTKLKSYIKEKFYCGKTIFV